MYLIGNFLVISDLHRGDFGEKKLKELANFEKNLPGNTKEVRVTMVPIAWSAISEKRNDSQNVTVKLMWLEICSSRKLRGQ